MSAEFSTKANGGNLEYKKIINVAEGGLVNMAVSIESDKGSRNKNIARIAKLP